MIAGAHTILFAHDAEAARAFFRDVLELDAIDAGHGWLIFELPPGELACHPAERPRRAPSSTSCARTSWPRAPPSRSAASRSSPRSATRGWGRLTRFVVPGYGELGLYEPRHPSPLAEFG